MAQPIIRYNLDSTGLNPDNLVIGELHTLSNTYTRALVPKYGPVFSESLVLYDNSNNTPLVPGDDYRVVELLQDATGKFGKEIIAAILIVNPVISSEIRLNYQLLGGLYQNDATAVINIYNNYLVDERSIDWVDVLNKPLQFPPTLHRHLLEDIYGFEPVIVALERVRNALALSNMPVYQALIRHVKSVVKTASAQDIIDGVSSGSSLITFDGLLVAMREFNFNTMTISPHKYDTVREGSHLPFTITTTNYPDPGVLYWAIVHQGTDVTDFATVSGVINISGNSGSFTVPLADNYMSAEPMEQFRVSIRKKGADGLEIASTGLMTLNRHTKGIDFLSAMMNCCVFNPQIEITPGSYFLSDH